MIILDEENKIPGENKDSKSTQLGLEQNVAGLLCYVLGWLTGIIFFVLEKENKFVRFHAMQSIITFGAITVFFIVLSIIQGILLSAVWFFFLIGIFSLISVIVSILTFALWIFLIVRAGRGETYKLPIVGEIAEKYVD